MKTVNKIEDQITQSHDYGICTLTRSIDISGEIDSDIRESVIKNLHILDNIDNTTVTIRLSTEGGCVINGLAIVDAIRGMKSYVRIIVFSEVSSMGTVILQAGDERCMMPNSFLMLHEGESGTSGKQKDRAEWERMQRWQEETCLDIYLSKIKEKKKSYSMKLLKQKLDKDWILFPEEAISWGLADKILDVY